MREELRGFRPTRARRSGWKQGSLPIFCLRPSWRTAGRAFFGAPTMIEAGNVLGIAAAILLLIAGVAWAKLIRGPLLQRTDGSIEFDKTEGELASGLLFWAAGLSIAAAFAAVGGWIFK